MKTQVLILIILVTLIAVLLTSCQSVPYKVSDCLTDVGQPQWNIVIYKIISIEDKHYNIVIYDHKYWSKEIFKLYKSTKVESIQCPK